MTGRDPRESAEATLYYDAVCHLCDGTVKWLIARDKDAKIRYVPLQSALAAKELAAYDVPLDMTTIYVRHGGVLYDRSSAALTLLGLIGGLWSAARLFWSVPKPLRDAVYSFIGRRRYRWFGRAEHCMLPDSDMRTRFDGLDDVD